MNVIPPDEYRSDSMRTLMIDVSENRVLILGSEIGSGEMILARSVGDCSKILDAGTREDGYVDTNKILEIYNNSDDGSWETLRLDAYLSNETIDLILG